MGERDVGETLAPAVVRKLFVPHTDMPVMTQAIVIVYCPTCGLTPDFCEWSGKFDTCKPWLIENYPHYYPQLAGMTAEEAQKKADEFAAKKPKVKELPGIDFYWN